MDHALVIVESPAKAKTIGKFLGAGFIVHASVGHIADLPSKGLGVDVHNCFIPANELTERGRKVIAEIKVSLKTATVVYLATDDDREGESIAWHLLQYLKPKVPVMRMVFHEITQSAIDHALANGRSLDSGLVDAAETRRIVDRLYGYTVSPVLWRKASPARSAGRVQSPATRLIVEREIERIGFVAAEHWTIAIKTGTAPSFEAKLLTVDGTGIAESKHFDSHGVPDAKVVALDESRATALAAGLEGQQFIVRSVDEKPYKSTPKPPFMTSTLQQTCGGQLRMSSSQVMRVAQGLYERGYITYMRTDNVAIGEEAMTATRSAIVKEYGQNFLSPSPKRYSSKSKNAQEAHEAIRPTTPYRSPSMLAGELNGTELDMYRMIWQRTLASQMADTVGTTLTLKLGAVSTHEATDCEFSAAGTTITFAGYRAVYTFSDRTADPETAADTNPDDDTTSTAALLPALAVGDIVPIISVLPIGRTTKPPARFTEPSLVKRLEELEIGRPSTWASIIQTIQDRGYVWKRKQELVPTWTAFAVVRLLEQHFPDLVDYKTTARIEDDLDKIADGDLKKVDWLTHFYFGDDGESVGLARLASENLDAIDAAQINTFILGYDANGEVIVAKPGKFGPYVKRGEDTASVPDDVCPDELTVAKAEELLALPKGDVAIGHIDGFPVFVKNGRFGAYVQWGSREELPTGLEKPRMSSLFKTMSVDRVTIEMAEQLLSLPRSLGSDDGVEIIANNGKFGPYIAKGKDFRNIHSEEQLFEITLDDAVRIFAHPKVFKGRGRSNLGAAGPLREFGEDPDSAKLVTAKDGKFGVYVTDGVTHASIGKGDRIESMSPERAFELLAARRDANIAKGATASAKTKRAPGKKEVAKTAAPKKADAPKPSE